MSSASRTGAWLAAAFVAPGLVWLTAFQVAYAIGSYGCEKSGLRLPLAALMGAALLAVGATIVFAAAHLRRVGTRHPGDPQRPFHRSRFLATGAIALGAQITAVIVAQLLVTGLAPACP